MRRLRGDDGATAFEFALIIVPLLLLIVGALDFGIFEYEQSEASSAARDGARVAILRYELADDQGSDDRKAIDDAVYARLGLRTAPFDVNVSCSSTPCASALIGTDTITVTVTSSYRSAMPGFSSLVGTSTIVESAHETITGLPQ